MNENFSDEFFFHHFTPSKATIPLERRVLQGVKVNENEKTENGGGLRKGQITSKTAVVKIALTKRKQYCLSERRL